MVENRARRLSAPWKSEQVGECYRVSTVDGQAVAFVYFDDSDQTAKTSPRLNGEQARRVAANIAKLPDLLRGKVGDQ